MEKFQDFDLLWIQSTPSIAAIFYQKYLKNTHALLCPDDVANSQQQQPREIVKNITTVMNSNEKKKVAIHFMAPLSVKRREAIFNLIEKSKPYHSSYCLSIPSTAFQSNLLLGWSAEIKDDAWKRRCEAEFEPESYSAFWPPTVKSGQSEWTEFIKEFVISKKRFSKKALIVDLTENMIIFRADKGMCFNPGVEDAIKGWISASRSLPSTLIWIIKEKSLYGDAINNKLHEKREKLLAEYRKLFIASIESFGTDIPIYCYTIDYFTTIPTSLAHCLAQIQHRHHLCLSRSILLKYDDEGDLHKEYFLNIKTIYLKKSPLFNESKWKSIFSSRIKEIKKYGYDSLIYISPELLGVKGDLDEKQYKIPLLSLSNIDLSSLSKFETIGINDASHTVSAKSHTIYDKWAQILMDFEERNDSLNSPLVQTIEKNDTPTLDQVAQALTVEMIKSFTNNEATFQRGEKIQNILADTRYEITNDNTLLKLSASAKGSAPYPYLVTIILNFDFRQQIIQEVSCPCPTGRKDGSCKHCVATLLYFLDNSSSFELRKPSSLSAELSTDDNVDSSLSSSSSSLGKKRSSDEIVSQFDEASQDDHKAGKKIKSLSHQSEEGYNSDATAPYDSNKIVSYNIDHSEILSLGSFDNVTINKRQVESRIVRSDKADDSSGNSCNTAQVYTANATLNLHINSLSSSSSSTMSLPPIPDSYNSASSKSVHSSSLSSSKKSSLSVPTVPSSASSSNPENNLPAFREEEEYVYQSLEQREEVSTMPYNSDNSLQQYQYEADTDEENDMEARIEDAPAGDTQPERQRRGDSAATQPYIGLEATQPYDDSDTTQSYHNDSSDDVDDMEARIEDVPVEDTPPDCQSHGDLPTTQQYVDSEATQPYQEHEISDDDYDYDYDALAHNEPVPTTDSKQEGQNYIVAMATQPYHHSSFDSEGQEESAHGKNSSEATHQDDNDESVHIEAIRSPNTQEAGQGCHLAAASPCDDEAEAEEKLEIIAAPESSKSSFEDDDEVSHERATLYATQSPVHEQDDNYNDLQEFTSEEWLGDLI